MSSVFAGAGHMFFDSQLTKKTSGLLHVEIVLKLNLKGVGAVMYSTFFEGRALVVVEGRSRKNDVRRRTGMCYSSSRQVVASANNTFHHFNHNF